MYINKESKNNQQLQTKEEGALYVKSPSLYTLTITPTLSLGSWEVGKLLSNSLTMCHRM